MHAGANGSVAMADVSSKEATSRVAVAKGCITMNEKAFHAVLEGVVKKGDVLGVARVAGIMAAKRTAELIPLCHTLSVDACSVELTPLPNTLAVEACCTVKTFGKTGVEMEALTGVSIALLTIYDMCKPIDHDMIIGNVRLWKKTGGKSGQ